MWQARVCSFRRSKGGKKQKNFTSDRCRQAEVFNLWAYSERESHLSYLDSAVVPLQSPGSQYGEDRQVVVLLEPEMPYSTTERCTAGRTYITVYGARVHILIFLLLFLCLAAFLSMRRIFFSTSKALTMIRKRPGWVAEARRGEKTIKGICHNIA